MPPVPPNTTKRIRAHYTGPFDSHTMLFHATTGLSDSDFIGDVKDIIDQMSNLQYNGTTWDTAEIAQPGSALFFPITPWDAITSGSGFNPTVGSGPSTFVQFGGRGLNGGVRVKLYLFETYLLPTHNMRYIPAENAAVDAVIAELVSADNNVGTISGDVVGWYNYANSGQNDFITHRARK